MYTVLVHVINVKRNVNKLIMQMHNTRQWPINFTHCARPVIGQVQPQALLCLP